MMKSNKKGVFQSAMSGVFWAGYSIILYSVLDPFSGDSGTIDSAKGIMFIILATVGIAWIDAMITGFFEISYCISQGKLQELKKLCMSKAFLKIMPAAIFAGPFGIVPYAIASRYSISIAMSVSAFFPAIGSVLAIFIYKEHLTPVKFTGILLAISGIVVISGYSAVHPIGVIIAVVAAIGYALELVFGYRLIAEDVDPIVSLALKQIAVIAIYTIALGVLLLIPGNIMYFKNFIAAVDFTTSYAFTVAMLGNKALIMLTFCIASFLNAMTYIFYFRGMHHAGISTASSLNISYGVWAIIILMLPPFLSFPTLPTVIGALLTFLGSVVVVIESNKLAKASEELAHNF